MGRYLSGGKGKEKWVWGRYLSGGKGKEKKWLVVILICKTSPRVQSGNQPILYAASIPKNATRLLPILQ